MISAINELADSYENDTKSKTTKYLQLYENCYYKI